MTRHNYYFDCSSELPTTGIQEGYRVRSPIEDDRGVLASLMVAAYEGTVDDEGGLLEGAENEIDNLFGGEYGEPLLNYSKMMCDHDGQCHSAVLVTRWGRRKFPLIAFAMTHPDRKGMGLARRLLTEVLAELKGDGEKAVCAAITEGNTPSERLFIGMGFTREIPTTS